MNKSLRYIAILAIVPLFTAGMGIGYFSQKLMHSKLQELAPQNMVLVLVSVDYNFCSEYPGGKAAWEAEQGRKTCL